MYFACEVDQFRAAGRAPGSILMNLSCKMQVSAWVIRAQTLGAQGSILMNLSCKMQVSAWVIRAQTLGSRAQF